MTGGIISIQRNFLSVVLYLMYLVSLFNVVLIHVGPLDPGVNYSMVIVAIIHKMQVH